MTVERFLFDKLGFIRKGVEIENMSQLQNDCNLNTCRYNKDGKCTNDEKRKECVEVSGKVLCLDER